MIVTPGSLNRRAELYHQLGSMLSAGVPLMKALEMAGANPALRASRKTFLGLTRHLQAGLTFGDSLVKVQGWMPEFDVSLLTVGEQSGRLDASFKLLSQYYATRAAIIRDTIAGLLPTIATLHVFLLIMPLNLLIRFVQGIFFNNYAECVPFIIEKTVVFGALYGLVFLLIYACQGQRGEPWRAFMESVAQAIPVLRTAQKYLCLSRLSAALEALTSAGVNLVEGWQLAAAASGSPRLRAEIAGWKAPLVAGATPGELINQSGYFPEMFANLYNTAEVSGKLDDSLQRLHVYYQEEGSRTLKVFTRILIGIIYTALVVVVAYFVFSFYIGRINTIMQVTQ